MYAIKNSDCNLTHTCILSQNRDVTNPKSAKTIRLYTKNVILVYSCIIVFTHFQNVVYELQSKYNKNERESPY